MGSSQTLILIFVLIILFFSFSSAKIGPKSPPPARKKIKKALSPEEDCNGVFLKYEVEYPQKIHPFYPDKPSKQPYAFHATATILNAADVPFPEWSLNIAYPKDTVLVSASDVVIADGSDFPYIIGQNDSVGVSFLGSPDGDLKTAIETAGEKEQISKQIKIVGTKFGNKTNLPSKIYLNNPEFICPSPSYPPFVPIPKATIMYTCCSRDPKYKSKKTSPKSTRTLPRRDGDLVITYDVIRSYKSSYLALVTIDNRNQLGRLDRWRLTWRWMRNEFVLKTQGAITTTLDVSRCLNGVQGKYYADLDFSTVENCEEQPTFVDLPLPYQNNTQVGNIPFCCRNGTILPEAMDEKKSKSAFQLQVFKMPPDDNRSSLFPPQSWRIAGADNEFNPKYKCGPAVKVDPTEFPDPRALPTYSLAAATWQVVCNITRKNVKPRCCVSFSGFYNQSVVPCKTCACGCPSKVSRTCSTRAPAMLLPSEALLVPYENRTSKAKTWAKIKHFRVPNPLPCPDNCGVTINWHLATDYHDGWSARITLMNWGDVDIADWFAAVVMPKAYKGFEALYSFEGEKVGNDTIFLQGLAGLNYLVKEDVIKEPKDGIFRNAGKLQSIISFKKKFTPGIDVVAGHGFPKKFYFNGEECSMPDYFPLVSRGFRGVLVGRRGVLVLAALLIFGFF